MARQDREGGCFRIASRPEFAPLRDARTPGKIAFMEAVLLTPWPLMEVAIGPKSGADRERLGIALSTLVAEDPSLRVVTDPDSGQTMLGGIGETHLEAKVDRLRRDHGIDVEVGAPQVAYRETVTRRIEQNHTHKQRTGGEGHFARVTLVVEPNEAGRGNTFETEIVDDAVPERFIPGVEEGVSGVMRCGVLAGFPLLDTKVTLVDGAYHDLDSSILAFETAARRACREALSQGSVLLEPIMIVELVTPERFAGSCIGDLNSRRGQIRRRSTRADAVVIEATVPLANMVGYVNQLRSFSAGRASFTMQFDRYAPSVSPDGRQPPPAAAAALRA